MRIENNLLITSDSRTDAGGMMSRLEAGDVISAKVLETSPGEAVLRLSDGTSLKARTTEAFDAKPGQSVSLIVTSRNGNSFVLETVRDVSGNIEANKENLQKMLEASGIRPDDVNLRLAAEFLKYGAKPTYESISGALESMIGSVGLDIEKAVYLVVNNINVEQADKDMLSSLLSGSLKLGRLLESLSKALNGGGEGTEAGNPNTEAMQTAFDSSSETITRSAQQTGRSAPDVEADSISSDRSPSSPVKNISYGSESSASEADNISSADKAAETVRQTSTAAIRQTEQTNINSTGAKSSPVKKTDIGADPNTRPETVPNEDISIRITKKSDTEPKSTFASENNASNVSEETDPVIRSTAIDSAFKENAANLKAADISQETEHLAKDALERINASIEKMYVDIHKQLSGEELDPENIKNRLSDISKELKVLIQSPEGSKAAATQASSALGLVEDTVRLLDMFNSNNVLYYQIPVKIDNYSSTAELYVMKRQKNKKRIDPNDSVLFLSLDTKNMGRVETILDVKGHSISISLRTENQAAGDFFRKNIQSLYSGLSECGYKLTDIRYSIIGSAAAPAQQEKLLTDAVRLKHGKVDLRI
jgi:hypothetical protein